MNSVLTTDELKEIANNIFPLNSEEYTATDLSQVQSDFDIFFDRIGAEQFDPINNDADCMKVLRALTELCKEKHLDLEICRTFQVSSYYQGDIFQANEFNNESICRAYLQVLRG